MNVNESLFNKWIIVVFYFIVLGSYSILWLPEHIIIDIGKEDAIIENIGALLFLGASILFCFAFLKSDFQSMGENRFITKRNLVYLFFAILMFVCFGEEISWGQRLLGFETPETVSQFNAQDEFNIHNLWIFHASNPNGSYKSFWALMLEMNRLFSIFWLGYFVVFPVVMFCFKKLHGIVQKVRLPVHSLWMGGLFLFSYLVFKIIYLHLYGSVPGKILGSINELKESIYAMNYFIFAVFELLRISKLKNENTGAAV
jgi:hypothetical protein